MKVCPFTMIENMKKFGRGRIARSSEETLQGRTQSVRLDSPTEYREQRNQETLVHCPSQFRRGTMRYILSPN